MDFVTFAAVLEAHLLRQLPGRWGSLAPQPSWWVDDGLVISWQPDGVQVRCGLVAQLRLSVDLIRDIARVNATLTRGAVWAAEGPGSAWQVVWGERFTWDQLPTSGPDGLDHLLHRPTDALTSLCLVADMLLDRYGGVAWRAGPFRPSSLGALLAAVST